MSKHEKTIIAIVGLVSGLLIVNLLMHNYRVTHPHKPKTEPTNQLAAYAITNSEKIVANIELTNKIHWIISTNEELWFGQIKNITQVHKATNQSGWGFFDSIDYAHPTNVEFIFCHEPVVSKASNGTWIVHFTK